MKLIPINWYFQSPIDFEHKQYILFAYLQEVDNLYLEKLEKELCGFRSCMQDTESNLKKQKYYYFQEENSIVYNDDLLSEVKDIVEFSIPQISSRIQVGYKIAAKYKQLLY